MRTWRKVGADAPVFDPRPLNGTTAPIIRRSDRSWSVSYVNVIFLSPLPVHASAVSEPPIYNVMSVPERIVRLSAPESKADTFTVHFLKE